MAIEHRAGRYDFLVNRSQYEEYSAIVRKHTLVTEYSYVKRAENTTMDKETKE